MQLVSLAMQMARMIRECDCGRMRPKVRVRRGEGEMRERGTWEEECQKRLA